MSESDWSEAVAHDQQAQRIAKLEAENRELRNEAESARRAAAAENALRLDLEVECDALTAEIKRLKEEGGK